MRGIARDTMLLPKSTITGSRTHFILSARSFDENENHQNTGVGFPHALH